MALNTGTRFGPYEILGAAGAGGMGEVYRARDTRLGRDVAIKVLPSHLSSNADLKQRFDREAKAISSLQHPHICTLFDVGEQDGVDFLVMEYLEGETLADRLTKGPLRLDEALNTGVEIADALEKAHRSGIVHRDLKPGNVMLTKAGAKLMDFGLAKPAVMTMGAATSHVTPNTPTMSVAALASPASPLTQKGTIVGTFQYMAPEVLQGADADARSDIFSFGCLLYEMVTGRRAFEGKSQVSVLAAILDREPEPISATQPLTPPALTHAITTCLAKDPDARWQSAGDIGRQLSWITQNSTVAPVVAARVARNKWPIAILVLLVALAAVAGGYWFGQGGKRSQAVRATIDAPEKTAFDSLGDFGGVPVLSPDGEKLAFVAHGTNNGRAIWVRSLDSFSSQRLDGTDGGYHPFWSADGQSIGFFASGKLNRIAATGGPVAVVAPAPNARGGTWLSDDSILFAPDFQSQIFRVSASGGKPEPVTKLDLSKHSTHRWPFALPDNKHFLYLATSHTGGHPEQNGVYFASLDGKENKLLVSSDAGALFVSGYLLFHLGGALMAQRMDPSSGELSGAPQMIADKIRNDSGIWRTVFTASSNGRLVYQLGTEEAAGSQLVWFDRTGKQVGRVGERSAYMDPRLSPDGKRLAVSNGDPNREIWVFDLERGTSTRLTFGGSARIQPSWSPDGKLIAYTVAIFGGGGSSSTYVKASNGSGAEKQLIEVKNGSSTYADWSPDGKYVVYLERFGPTGHLVKAIPAGGGDAFTVVPPASPQSSILYYRISPNGRWIAYVSDESGRSEVYIAPFPSGEGKWQVSTSGAGSPAWRRDGKELYFSTNTGDYMACTVDEVGNEPRISTPSRMFSANVAAIGTDYDASADGKRFLMNLATEEDLHTTLRLVTNWMAELKKK